MVRLPRRVGPKTEAALAANGGGSATTKLGGEVKQKPGGWQRVDQALGAR